MSRALPATLRRVAVGSALGLSLVAGLLAAPAQAAPEDDLPANTECPGILPVGDLRAGQTGTGLTVVRGAEPQPFTVEILGVLENGIGAGKDLIVVEASDLPGRTVIGAGGGIWAGMSGSPVYVDGRLIGAIGYGFSASPSPIGGITPAADMLDVLDLSRPAAARQPAAAAAAAPPATVQLSAAQRRALGANAAAAVPSGSLRALPTPMSLSGLSSRRVAQFQSDAAAGGLDVVAHAGSSAVAPGAGPRTRPQAGGNFAGMLAYGDFTAAGVGTTTLVCEDQALAFGHPFNYAGPVNYGANDANSVSIIKDTSFGPYKLASPTALFGRVDQDRLAAIRADLSRGPALTPIRSTIRNVDTGERRRGSTSATDKLLLAPMTAYGLAANFDATFDERGDGRSSANWTITGTRAGGKAFTMSRGNRFASREDIAWETSVDAAFAVESLLYNEFEPVTINRVSLVSGVSTTYRDHTITKIAVSVNGGTFTTPKVLRVKGGSTLQVRVSMRTYGGAPKTTTLSMRVPRAKGREGALLIAGGATLAQEGEEDLGCLFDPDKVCEEVAEPSLDSLIAGIEDGWRNDDVAARLVLDASEPGQRPIRKVATARQTEVVYGAKELAVEIR